MEEGHPDFSISISLERHIALEPVLRPVTPPTVQRSPVTIVTKTQYQHNSRGRFVLTLAALFTTGSGLSAVEEGHPDISISLEWHIALEPVLRPVTPPTVQRSPVTIVTKTQYQHNSRGGFVLTLAALFTTGLSAVDELSNSSSEERNVTLVPVLPPAEAPPTVRKSLKAGAHTQAPCCVCVCVCVCELGNWETRTL